MGEIRDLGDVKVGELAQMSEDEIVVRFEDLRKFRELQTDPDLNEFCDDLAERVRALITEQSDYADDLVANLAASYWFDEMDELIFPPHPDRQKDERLVRIEAIVQRAIRSGMNARLTRLAKTGDWRIVGESHTHTRDGSSNYTHDHQGGHRPHGHHGSRFGGVD